MEHVLATGLAEEMAVLSRYRYCYSHAMDTVFKRKESLLKPRESRESTA